MRYSLRAPFTVATLTAVLALGGGCAPQAEQSGAPAPSTTGEGSSAPAALGTQRSAGHMELKLTTEPEAPKTGDVTFIAEVGHHGSPHTGATVSATLSMPSMKMDEPKVDLKHTDKGRYEGKAKLTMSGKWRATVQADDGHDSQTFIYEFDVAQ